MTSLQIEEDNMQSDYPRDMIGYGSKAVNTPVSYTHLRAHET